MSTPDAKRSVLQIVLDAEHARISELACQAEFTEPKIDDPRLRRRLTDTFSAVLSQHLAAVDDVLLAEAKDDLAAGHEWVQYYVRHTRTLEQSLHRLKGWIYGDVTSQQVDWHGVWREMSALLDDHVRLEHTLADELLKRLGHDEEARVAERLRVAQERAPTRPHPFTPHTGLAGRITHRLWRIWDSFWDHAEGRVVSHGPLKQPEHPDSLGHRYFTGAPAHRE
jgi:hypothetical protein